ncbi:MAG: hypothetical protein HY928_15120 [Elusimicrobia bacterium]|nr:hypothetical protein [Elusimicrobiota bacterium]
MGDQHSGFDQSGRGAGSSEVDIPILKKQEKEKKGAGAIIGGAAAEGGQLAAGAGVAKAGGLLALFGGKLGLAALVMGVGGAGVIALGVASQKGAATPKSAPQLGALSSKIAVGARNAYGSKSLNYMSEAGAGQLNWDDPNKPKPVAAPDKTADAPADGAAVAEADGAAEDDGMPNPLDGKPRMANDMAGAKLSSSLGKSSAFGSKNIFAKGTGFSAKGMDLKAKSTLGPNLSASRSGRMAASRRGKSSLSAKAISTNKITGKSLGQLKFAGNRSQAAMNAGDSGAASTYAADAFDQQRTTGGQLDAGGGPADGLGTVNPVGSGAPDSTGSEAMPCPEGWGQAEGGGCLAPDITNGKEMTNYQSLVDGALQMQKTAAKLMMIGMALIVAGAIVMATTSWMGIGTLIGGLMIAAGLALVVMGQMMNKQADQMADQIGGMYDQKKQADLIKARGDGDSSTPELERRRVADQTEQANEAGYTEEETQTPPGTEPQ